MRSYIRDLIELLVCAVFCIGFAVGAAALAGLL